MSRIFAHSPRQRRQDPLRESVAARIVIAGTLVLAALTGSLSGCLSAYAPAIVPRDHHEGLLASDGGACMDCHGLESAMAEHMRGMDAATLAEHVEEMATSDAPPLVQDWMVEDPRGCLDCHRLRAPREARR